MAATVGIEHSDYTAEVANTPGQKRKRNTESSSPESRRKRGAPAASMGVADPDTQSFLDDTVSIAQAAQDHVNVDDFTALAQAAQDHNSAADTATASSTAAAALNMYPTLHVPPTTEETFAASAGGDSHHDDSAFNTSAVSQPDGLPMAAPSTLPTNGVQGEQSYRSHNPKPSVGSDEWHAMRKNNHKEVERRRRETINEGINELAKMVPGCEKNKGQILARAVAFITQLKENESQNFEKWTLEKLLTEQAIAELSESNDKLKNECERLFRELEAWKKLAQSAGLQLPQKEEPGASS
ncbi:hypothetical protein B0T14DRAFT_494671 [Immersiella caudata]|uniref:BHLH domain-containing protein n=1 Tax=Immersiella caudata TaxID=314043 RepID=A0AA39WX05_9PEZI|nr:hypothetical protein B0T14DRAFT_494671 [Immersiella caudata]